MTQYTVNTLLHRSAGLNEENILSYTPNPGLRPILAGPGHMLNNGLTITEAAERLRRQGYDIVGGINGSFFNTNMTTIGLQIRDGVITSYNRESTSAAAGFTASGEVVLGVPGIAVSVASAEGTVLVDRLNMVRSPDRVHMYTPEFSSTTRTTQDGVHVVIRSNGQLRLGGTFSGTVRQVLRGTAAHTIADNEIVLSASTRSAIDRIAFLTAGSTVTISAVSESPRWNNVHTASVGLRFLVRNGQSTGASDGGRAPRTAIGVRADGSVVFYTVDGRQSGHSAGMTLSEVAARLIDMGCITAVEMDGGGSTAMIARIPGDQTAGLVNKPSDGRMRRCADFILLANIAARSDGRAAHLFPRPSYVTMLPNASALFTLRATDNHYRAVDPPSGQVVSQPSNPAVGTSSGLTFTALNPGDTFVTFTSGGVSGTAQVRVPSRLDSVTLTANGQTVGELSVSSGQTVRLAASAMLDRAPVLSTARSYIWSVTGNIGTVSADGIFTSAQGPGSRTGRITATAIGTGSSVSLPVTVTAGSDNPLIRIEGPRVSGSELVYTLTALDTSDRVPANISIKWNGGILPAPAWNSGGRAEVRVPNTASGLHVISIDAADAQGRRTRRIHIYEPVQRDRWYTNYVEFLAERNVLDVSEGYDPAQPTTRLEVAHMFSRALNLPEGPSVLPFDDIAGLDGYDLAAVRAVFGAGIFNGRTRSDGTILFDPFGYITRAELFTVLERTYPQGYDQANLSRFSDAGSVPSWALHSTQVLAGMGTVHGSNGRLNPNGHVLRSEVCALFVRLLY
jgi:exopolysaccharide biosynthesis protein